MRDQPFQHPAWLRAYAETFRRRVEVACSSDGWLALERRGMRWKTAASSVSDLGEPVLRDSASRDSFLGSVPGRPVLCGLLAPARDAVPVSRGHRLWLAGPSPASRNLRRDAAAMARQGWKLEWRPGASAGDRFEALVGLHRDRWRRRGLPGAFWGRRLAFHRRFLGVEGPGALLCAVREGEVGGVLYLLRTPERWAYYQAGIRTGAGLSLGTFLIEGAIRIAREEGAEWFDFLRGEEAYKRRWAPDGEYAIYRSDPLLPASSRLALWTERLKVRFETFG